MSECNGYDTIQPTLPRDSNNGVTHINPFIPAQTAVPKARPGDRPRVGPIGGAKPASASMSPSRPYFGCFDKEQLNIVRLSVTYKLTHPDRAVRRSCKRRGSARPLMLPLRNLLENATGMMDIGSMGPTLSSGDGRDGTLNGLVILDLALFGFELHLNKALSCHVSERD